MTGAFISAIEHQKRATTQTVIPIFRWGDCLIMRHCLQRKSTKCSQFPARQGIGRPTHHRRDRARCDPLIDYLAAALGRARLLRFSTETRAMFRGITTDRNPCFAPHRIPTRRALESLQPAVRPRRKTTAGPDICAGLGEVFSTEINCFSMIPLPIVFCFDNYSSVPL